MAVGALGLIVGTVSSILTGILVGCCTERRVSLIKKNNNRRAITNNYQKIVFNWGYVKIYWEIVSFT